jgi:hypothetical protein
MGRWFTGVLSLCVAAAAFGQDSRSTGLVFLEDQAYQSIPLAATPLLGELPTEVDLSSRFPTPGNQGRQSSCVGWAVAYALKSYQEGVERGWSLESPSARFSPAFIYNQIKQGPDCRGGTRYIDALNLVRRDGSATLAQFPYDEGSCSTQPSVAIKQSARAFAIADWRRVNVQDEMEIKTQVASGFPVLVAVEVDSGFSQLRGDQVYAQFSGQNRSGHAMVLVGYSDERRAYKLINSWGTDWGAGGYGWVSYAAFGGVAREGYVAQDIVPVAPPRPPVELPPNHPLPIEPPQPAPPSAAIGAISFQHNATVGSPTGPAPGMLIYVPTELRNLYGQSVQVVVKFNLWNGPPLFAHPREVQYRDIGGLVATGTTPRIVGSNHERLGNEPVAIPYYVLNLVPSGGVTRYQLMLTAYVFAGNTLLSQSAPVPFWVQW